MMALFSKSLLVQISPGTSQKQMAKILKQAVLPKLHTKKVCCLLHALVCYIKGRCAEL